MSWQRAAYHEWTEPEKAKLFALVESGADWPAVGAALGLSPDKCKSAYANFKYRRRIEQGIRPQVAPNKVLIDRERRNDARCGQDITGVVFGDPPPGFSMLDRRARPLPDPPPQAGEGKEAGAAR